MRAMAEGAERQIRAPNAPQAKRKRSDPPEREGAGEGGEREREGKREDEFELEGEQRTVPTLPPIYLCTWSPLHPQHAMGTVQVGEKFVLFQGDALFRRQEVSHKRPHLCTRHARTRSAAPQIRPALARSRLPRGPPPQQPAAAAGQVEQAVWHGADTFPYTLLERRCSFMIPLSRSCEDGSERRRMQRFRSGVLGLGAPYTPALGLSVPHQTRIHAQTHLLNLVKAFHVG